MVKLATDFKNADFKAVSSGYKIPSFGTASAQGEFIAVESFPFSKSPFVNGSVEDNFKLVGALGKSLLENYMVKNKDTGFAKAESMGLTINKGALQEGLGGKYTLKEDLTTSNSTSLYVKFLHETVYGDIAWEVEPYMKLVNVNEDLMGKTGVGSIQIPKIYPGIASSLAEDGEIIYFGSQTTDIEIKCSVKAIGTKITWQLMKRGLDGVVKLMMRFSSNALARKISSDIVNTLAAGATQSETGGTTYDNIVDARADVNAAKYGTIPYGFKADKLVIDVLEFATLQKTSDYKNHVFRATILPGEKTATINRMAQYFGDLEIVEVNVLDTTVAKALVLDSRFAGIFVKESDYLTFERDLPNTFGSKEIVLGMSYGVGVLFGDAISKITA